MNLIQAFPFNALRGTVKTTVARLQPKEEVLLLGWGVPMPLPARRVSRRYDDAFWKEFLDASAGGKKSETQNLKELGF